MWKASRYGMRANDVLSLFAEKRARRGYRARGMIHAGETRGKRKRERERGSTNRVSRLSFFLSYLLLLAHFVSL